MQPEHVVTFSENLIEGLVKDLWKGEISSSSREGSLWNVLREHCKSSDEDECRFARIALTLYDVYRKPAQHDMHSFHCTWSEARFFHIGIKTLLELSDSIKKRQLSDH